MAYKLIYIPNDNTQNYPFCRLLLEVETFKHSTQWKLIKVSKVVEPTNKKTSAINSPLSPPILTFLTDQLRIFNQQEKQIKLRLKNICNPIDWKWIAYFFPNFRSCTADTTIAIPIFSYSGQKIDIMYIFDLYIIHS